MELALEASHALHSREAHPLLEEELRLIATPVEIVTTETEPIPKEEELTEYLGTLTLDKSGTQYFGTAGAYAVSTPWRVLAEFNCCDARSSCDG